MSPADFVRRILPKQQSRRERRTPKSYRRPEGFPKAVQDDIIVPRSGGLCELDLCGPAVWFHHRRPRLSGGTSLEWVDRAANSLHLSDACHQWVEGSIRGSSRTRSKILGWLISQHADVLAEDAPVLYRGRWVFLTDDGDVNPIVDVTLLSVLVSEESNHHGP